MTKPRLFQLIDLDRTLFDTARFAQAITDELEWLQPGMGVELHERFMAAHQREETFFLLRYLRNEKGDAWFEELVDAIIRRNGAESFALPGMRERLAFAETLSDESPAWGILTYGDEVDQRMKIAILGLESAPVYFAYTPDKADILQSWRTEDGTFQLPEVFGGRVVDELTLEDDKLRAFEHLPPRVTGLWLTQGRDKVLAEDLALVPVLTLFDSIEYLKKKYL